MRSSCALPPPFAASPLARSGGKFARVASGGARQACAVVGRAVRAQLFVRFACAAPGPREPVQGLGRLRLKRQCEVSLLVDERQRGDVVPETARVECRMRGFATVCAATRAGPGQHEFATVQAAYGSIFMAFRPAGPELACLRAAWARLPAGASGLAWADPRGRCGPRGLRGAGGAGPPAGRRARPLCGPLEAEKGVANQPVQCGTALDGCSRVRGVADGVPQPGGALCSGSDLPTPGVRCARAGSRSV